MEFETQVKLAVFHQFAETGKGPNPREVADRVGSSVDLVLEAYPRLRALRVLVLEEDGTSIRMASPFSGIPTQHVVESEGVRYFANCAWDALGVVAAIRIDQLWRLAVAWYSTRLQDDSRRPQPEEMREIFAGLGLDGDFWDPMADSFG